MSNNNGESYYQGYVPMANLRKHLEALCLENWGSSTSVVVENPTPTRADLINLLLIKLLQKHI